ncbi:MAG: hypothetical protein HQ567_08900 [Candidatus Nealsonbacteria bacterium]|nr:hypothetical protein [Candidatus Nealsonbacteria bacterium]
MNVLLCLLIAAAGSNPPLAQRYPEAEEVFRCQFDSSQDTNFDGWPDGWVRGDGPHYIPIRIVNEPSPAGAGCLRIDLDGGKAIAYSPPIKIVSVFSYVLEGLVKTEGLKHDRAFFSVSLLDKQHQRIQTFYSEKVRETDGWQKLRLGPFSPENDEAQFVVVGLHVEPQSRQDLKGTVLFDDVWLGSLPRLTLKSTDEINCFTDADDVAIKCIVSLASDNADLASQEKSTLGPEITFQLEDVLGKELATYKKRPTLQGADGGDNFSLDNLAGGKQARIGEVSWKPPITDPGFYRVRATMKGRTALVRRQELTLVLIEPRRSPLGGVFGWTLPDGDKPLPLPVLRRLIAQAGVNWVKYPLWFNSEKDEALVSQLIAFDGWLSNEGIELVGLLHDPPPSLDDRYGRTAAPTAADIFAPEPKVWYPSLEPVMARLATRVRWWQLGSDTDVSFVGYPNLAEKITQVKTELDRIGQNVRLGIGWSWRLAPPTTVEGRPPWQFLALSADPPLLREEIAARLEAYKDAGAHRWVVVTPMPAGETPVADRATDLVRRMIAAKAHGAEAIFCPQPFSTDRGLMHDDGTPGELFLPWRTTALELGAATYLGSIQLPGGSPNMVFTRSDDAVMVVWNDKPTEEAIYLGENVSQIDLWGNVASPARRDHRQVIRVGQMPSFVTGLNELIARWRMDVMFARERIPSVLGRSHGNAVRMTNHFPEEVRGEVRMTMPKAWSVKPKQFVVQLAQGQSLEQSFTIGLPHNASNGRSKIRLDFEVQGDRPYRFSIYRQMSVGLGNIDVEIATKLNDRGQLEVEQRFINVTDEPASFRCHLYAPDRRRQMSQVVGLGLAEDVHVYRLPDGEKLLGMTLWLRAEEIDGPRVLNYRFVAEP